MENVFLTSLTTPEVRALFREELTPIFDAIKKVFDTPTLVPEKDENYDIDETAAYLKCTKQTVHNYNKSGLLTAYRLGRKVYFKKSEIDAAAKGIRAKKQKKG